MNRYGSSPSRPPHDPDVGRPEEPQPSTHDSDGDSDRHAEPGFVAGGSSGPRHSPTASQPATCHPAPEPLHGPDDPGDRTREPGSCYAMDVARMEDEGCPHPGPNPGPVCVGTPECPCRRCLRDWLGRLAVPVLKYLTKKFRLPEEAALEATQEMCVRVLELIDDDYIAGKKPGHREGFVYRTAYYICKGSLRGRGPKHVPLDFEDDALAVPGDCGPTQAEEEAHDIEKGAALRARDVAMTGRHRDAMPATDRRILELRLCGDRKVTFAAIGRATNLSETHARRRFWKAYRRLEALLLTS